jgi:hypothetical protein
LCVKALAFKQTRSTNRAKPATRNSKPPHPRGQDRTTLLLALLLGPKCNLVATRCIRRSGVYETFKGRHKQCLLWTMQHFCLFEQARSQEAAGSRGGWLVYGFGSLQLVAPTPLQTTRHAVRKGRKPGGYFYDLVATPKQWQKPSSSVRKNSVWP